MPVHPSLQCPMYQSIHTPIVDAHVYTCIQACVYPCLYTCLYTLPTYIADNLPMSIHILPSCPLVASIHRQRTWIVPGSYLDRTWIVPGASVRVCVRARACVLACLRPHIYAHVCAHMFIHVLYACLHICLYTCLYTCLDNYLCAIPMSQVRAHVDLHVNTTCLCYRSVPHTQIDAHVGAHVYAAGGRRFPSRWLCA